jgi:CcmD family protein
MNFLYTAYAITWVIHLAYLTILRRGFKRAKQELEALQRK